MLHTWLRSNFSAVLRSLDWAFSRCLLRAITVRRLRAGVPPSNTNTGLVRRYNSLQIRRKKPSKCALRTISPFSSRIAFMNCIIHMLASVQWNKLVTWFDQIELVIRFSENKLGLRGRVGVPIASLLPARVSTETRRPTGASSSQRPWTPIVWIACWERFCNQVSVLSWPPVGGRKTKETTS